MTFPITSLYAATLALMMIALAAGVIIKRGKSGVSIMHGDDMNLALAMRRHGNFIENVPMALILMALAEVQGAAAPWLHVMGLLLVASRVVHAVGLNIESPSAPARIIGASATFLCIIAASAYLLWQALH